MRAKTKFILFTDLWLNMKVRLSRNMCLLLTAILHFIHGMTDPVLMSLSASHVSSVRRHFPVLLVSMALFVLPVVLSYSLWHHYALNTWLFAVTAFCVELCLKVGRLSIGFSISKPDNQLGRLFQQNHNMKNSNIYVNFIHEFMNLQCSGLWNFCRGLIND